MINLDEIRVGTTLKLASKPGLSPAAQKLRLFVSNIQEISGIKVATVIYNDGFGNLTTNRLEINQNLFGDDEIVSQQN